MINRRTAMGAVAASALIPAMAKAGTSRGESFPKGFLWGAATAGHQVEGNNLNSDSWVLEHVKPNIFAEPSGDACDSYHRYREDIAIVRALGLNTYRFGIEWSRIEPEEGQFSLAELDHYRAMIDAVRAAGLRAFVTYSHFTVPRWFAARGGWEEPANADLFVRFCDRVTRHMGAGISHALTFNEPNLAALIGWIPYFANARPAMDASLAAAARAVGSSRFSSSPLYDTAKVLPVMLDAHRRGRVAIKAIRPDLPVGVSLAMQDEQAAGPGSKLAEKLAQVYQPWLEAARSDDFIGVQTYSRNLIGPEGNLPPPAGAELTQSGFEFYPEALGNTVRYAAREARVPVIVTENGISTADDSRRVAYIDRALKSLKSAMADGVDVRGYIHWSLLDNFEWNSGYKPTYGLVAVDRTTFKRMPKPSAGHLGAIATTNGASIG